MWICKIDKETVNSQKKEEKSNWRNWFKVYAKGNRKWMEMLEVVIEFISKSFKLNNNTK